MAQGDAHLGELRLLLEELCCDLCRFEHVIKDQLGPETIRIDREYWLGAPGAFADIRVCPPGEHPYFVEVKFGYTREMLLRHLARKYKSYVGEKGASKIVLVIDRTAYSDWDQLQRDVVACLHAGLALEVWDEDRLLSLLAERFGVTIPQITPDDLLDVRQAIDRAKGFHAFRRTFTRRIRARSGCRRPPAFTSASRAATSRSCHYAHSAGCTSAPLAIASTLRLDSSPSLVPVRW
jgi:adenylate cyclase